MTTTSSYADWLETTAAELERQADEDEALAIGRGMTGHGARFSFDALERAEAKRARVHEYRSEARQQRRRTAQRNR